MEIQGIPCDQVPREVFSSVGLSWRLLDIVEK